MTVHKEPRVHAKLSKGEGVIYEFVSIVNFCSPLKFSRFDVTFLTPALCRCQQYVPIRIRTFGARGLLFLCTAVNILKADVKFTHGDHETRGAIVGVFTCVSRRERKLSEDRARKEHKIIIKFVFR